MRRNKGEMRDQLYCGDRGGVKGKGEGGNALTENSIVAHNQFSFL